MSKLLKEGTESSLLFKSSFEALSDINHEWISQLSAVNFKNYKLTERIVKNKYFINKRKNGYLGKDNWFDSQYHLYYLQ